MDSAQQSLFTCISCAIAFFSAEEQRVHYRSDHHRYNMKRRVASLPPVSVSVFNEKVLERRKETAIMSSLNGSSCEVCNKTYSTENGYRSHIQSKKHKENEIKIATKPIGTPSTPPSAPTPSEPTSAQDEMDHFSANDDDDINLSIDQKIAAARSRISCTECLFCSLGFSSIEDNLTHMSTGHSFFIPDADFLVDLPGLIQYLGEKVAVGNVCLYCNGKGREFRTLDAVRKHMLNKGHCKIAYFSEKERMEFSDYYDFTSSYPDATSSEEDEKEEGGEWEDIDGESDASGDQAIEADSTKLPRRKNDGVLDNELAYGDSEFELVLPSGARIGHRSMRRYYAQSFIGLPRPAYVDPNSGAGLVRKLIADRHSALVPSKGGFGAYGDGTEVVKARNRGEAREAGRHVREFRDQKKREDFKTKIGFIHNSQKHFRDPLLQ